MTEKQALSSCSNPASDLAEIVPVRNDYSGRLNVSSTFRFPIDATCLFPRTCLIIPPKLFLAGKHFDSPVIKDKRNYSCFRSSSSLGRLEPRTRLSASGRRTEFSDAEQTSSIGSCSLSFVARARFCREDRFWQVYEFRRPNRNE